MSNKKLLTLETIKHVQDELQYIAKIYPQIKDNVIISSLPGFSVCYGEKPADFKSDGFSEDRFLPNNMRSMSYTVSNSRKVAFYETKADIFRELISQAEAQDKMLAVYAGTEDMLHNYPDGSKYIRYTFVDKVYKEESEK